MSGKTKLLFAGTAALLALLAFSTLILPVIVREKAAIAISSATGRPARIEKVGINPLTLTLTVSGLSVDTAAGEPFVTIGTLRASLGLASIVRGALIVTDISIDRPSAKFSRLAANRYSFSDIVERLKSKPKTESGPFHYSFNNIVISNGSIDFDDQAVPGGRKHIVRQLDIALPFISNIPYLVEKYTDPRISARVNGAPFSFSGKVKPLSKTMETSVHIDLRQLSLPEYLAYSPAPLPAELSSGTLTVNADLKYRISNDKKPELGISGMFRLDDIALSLKGNKPLLHFAALQLNASELEIFARRFLFDSIKLEKPELYIRRDAHGKWSFDPLRAAATPDREPSPPAAPEKSGRTPVVQVSSFALTGGSVQLQDALPAGGFTGALGDISGTVTGFSTKEGTPATFELSMALDRATTFRSGGTFSVSPKTVTAACRLNGMRLQRGWPYLSRFLAAPLNGTVDISATAAYSVDQGFSIADGAIRASGISTRCGERNGVELARLSLNGARYRQSDNAVVIDEIRLSGGNVSLTREPDGSFPLLSLARPKPSPAAGVRGAPPSTPGGTARRQLPEFSYRIDKVVVDTLSASFTDTSREEHPRFTLGNVSMSMANLNGPKFTPVPLRLSSMLNRSTPLKASGELTPSPLHYRGTLEIGQLRLNDFEEYFPENLNVYLLGGTFDTSLTVDVALTGGQPTGSFKGSAGIRSFHAVDSVAEEDLLTWESLQLDGIQGGLGPFSLSLREIALNGVYSRIIIRPDGTLNLQNLIQKENVPSDSRPTPPAAQSVISAAPPPRRAPIKIDAFTIQEGTLSFTDNHLPQRYSTTFHNLGGRVSGLSSEEVQLADVDLRGNLENLSPLRITGTVNPLRNDLFVDLKIAFQGIDLAPVTPYSGTFLGYTVEKGKLSLDLKYLIDRKKLDAENRIFIDQFTFGQKVESEKATRLPVKLGLALLKDRNGEIRLDVPVTGRTDDPKFSVWRLVFQVVRNLLVKAVTSPFSLISSLFGGGQDLSSIRFEHGLHAIPRQEQQKLTALARALLERPALRLELKGYVDREKDTEAYRAELLDRKLRNEKFLALGREGKTQERETADSIRILPEEYATYLKAVYRKEKFPKPRTVIGLVKDLPPEEMRKLILTNTQVGEAELRALAQERVTAVASHLVGTGGIPAERVFQKNDDIFKASDSETGAHSRVELNVTVP